MNHLKMIVFTVYSCDMKEKNLFQNEKEDFGLHRTFPQAAAIPHSLPPLSAESCLPRTAGRIEWNAGGKKNHEQMMMVG